MIILNLVLMDTLLQQKKKLVCLLRNLGFNPCFNGCTTSTAKVATELATKRDGFNPCFNGYTTSTVRKVLETENYQLFQSLF